MVSARRADRSRSDYMCGLTVDRDRLSAFPDSHARVSGAEIATCGPSPENGAKPQLRHCLSLCSRSPPVRPCARVPGVMH